MARRDEQRRNRILALSVLAVAVGVFVGLFAGRRAHLGLDERISLRVDFRTISGLRKGSPVQLAGAEVGAVRSVEFVNVSYECDPLTEDVGRYGAGRTDDCDDFLFCTPARLCGELEPFAGKGFHARCDTPEDCQADEICVVGEFRRHAPRVFWSGPLGVCARFGTEHWRTRVTLDVHANNLDLIRNDSRAMVAANSPLGDQLVNIYPGRGDPLGPERRIQARSSLAEDIERLRRRIDSATRNADDSLLAIVHVIDELQDERTIRALKGTIYNLEVITREIAYGDGLVGALMNSQSYKNDVGLTIAALKSTSGNLEVTAWRANRLLEQVDRNLVPVLADAQATLAVIDALLVDIGDPSNGSLGSKLLRDDQGILAGRIAAILHNTAELAQSTEEIGRAIDEGDGTVGKLINDPTLRHDIGLLLDNIAERPWLRRFLRNYLQRKGFDIKGSQSGAGPPRNP